MQNEIPAVEPSRLPKVFGTTRAVDGVDLNVVSGSVYGVLLGPNGAGKTTMIRVLATLLRPDGGTARVLGHDVAHEPAAVRAKVRLTGQFASVDEDLTGRENLVLVARLFGFCASTCGSWSLRLRAGSSKRLTSSPRIRPSSAR
jgi:ABC-2 type transport system ATP-binding protein